MSVLSHTDDFDSGHSWLDYFCEIFSAVVFLVSWNSCNSFLDQKIRTINFYEVNVYCNSILKIPGYNGFIIYKDSYIKWFFDNALFHRIIRLIFWFYELSFEQGEGNISTSVYIDVVNRELSMPVLNVAAWLDVIKSRMRGIKIDRLLLD